MPIYEYECEQCGKIEEVLQKISDEPLSTCKYCSGSLHKLMSMNSFHLKGTGWYVTDYANKVSHSSTPAKKRTDTAETKVDTSKKSADKNS